MHFLEKKICHTVATTGAVGVHETVVAGVSGGPDSMALLHLLKIAGDQYRFSVAVAHLDHGLRPKETAQEKKLVHDTCRELDIAFYCRTVDTSSFARTKKLSIEDAARRLRLDFFQHTKKTAHGSVIALGHTGDDQAEELLLRMIRGSGRKGLAGMQVFSRGVFRPLLHTSKKEIIAYLNDRAIPYAIDSSNSDRRFTRNRVRLDLIPYLEEHFNPSIIRSLRATATILEDEETLLEKMTGAAWEQTTMEHDDHQITFYLEKIRATPRAIQRRLMERACWDMGSRPSSRQIESLINILAPQARGTRVHLTHGLRAEKTKEALVFSHPMGRGPFRGDR